MTCGGSFTDVSGNTWTATVNYGDGSDVQPLTIQVIVNSAPPLVGMLKCGTIRGKVNLAGEIRGALG